MTESRKRVRKPRGVPIPLGSWWFLEATTAFGDRSHELVAEMVNRAANNPNERWEGNELGKLRRGETQPTLPLIRAISRAFSVTNPVFVAQSRDEAVDMLGVQIDHQQRRARAAEQGAIEAPDITARMAAHLEQQLGPEEIAALNTRTKSNKTKRVRRVLRGEGDRAKK